MRRRNTECLRNAIACDAEFLRGLALGWKLAHGGDEDKYRLVQRQTREQIVAARKELRVGENAR